MSDVVEREEAWTIALGDWPAFQIVRCAAEFKAFSDEGLNGRYPSRLAALDAHIANQEAQRADLAVEIARAKRMRATALRASLTPTPIQGTKV